MPTRLRALLMVTLPVSLVPLVALADTCGDYPLTDKQQSYLDATPLDIAVPDATVPTVQRCDVDGNSVINNDDLSMIRAHRGEAALHPDDPMDWDGNGIIHGRDVGGCASACNSGGKNGCAVKDDDAEEKDGFLAAQQLNAMQEAAEAAACYQVGDFDDDGVDDFVGIFEYVGTDTRGGNWTLQTVILTEDSNGNVQHITFPYTGQLDSASNTQAQHLSYQPAGVVNLNPGMVTIDAPGVVSYRNGEPKVLFYYDNGELALAFFGIDD